MNYQLSKIPSEQARATFGKTPAALKLYDISSRNEVVIINRKLSQFFKIIKIINKIEDKRVSKGLMNIYLNSIKERISLSPTLSEEQKTLILNLVKTKIKTICS